MSIIKQYHKDTDTTYVYESTSYWDAEKGQSRSKRKVIGKVDPVTGEIVPTDGRGRGARRRMPRSRRDACQQGRRALRHLTSSPFICKMNGWQTTLDVGGVVCVTRAA